MTSRAVKQVVVIRRDLRMRRGKEIAQGAHASIAFLTSRLRPVAAGSPVLEGRFTAAEHEWITSGFRKITVAVSSEEELLDVVARARAAGLAAHLIQDSGLTEFGGVATFTAAAIGPDYDSKMDPVTGGLTLY